MAFVDRSLSNLGLSDGIELPLKEASRTFSGSVASTKLERCVELSGDTLALAR